MNSAIFECETITPIFLAGADGVTPELRPPSIKGMMRFWWRAMHGHMTIEKLKEDEAKIFGSSDEKVGRSKFNIQTSNGRLDIKNFYLLPHRDTRKAYGKAISPDQVLNIKLSSHEDISYYSRILELSLILGGMGKRSRRGFGSIKILKIDEKSHNKDIGINKIFDLINYVSGGAYKIDDNKIVLINLNNQQYPFLKEVVIGYSYESWGELLTTVGVASHKCKDKSLGFAGNGSQRLASPIYVSVLKNGDTYLPIISTLNTAFEYGGTVNPMKQNEFKEMIL
ncbi:MAG: type III-B CRISPR module RAMP protein Cmr1 [Desulfobacula sp.]|nr:type III-B CRISPR module RAMP protein Cmr1 [Desulfobacula sp.]